MEEVTTCRRNSSIEAVHSQHTADTSINSVWEECTSKLFQICPYSLAGLHLHHHWAFPGTTSAHYLLCCYSKYFIEKELVSPQGGTRPTYTVYERLNHISYHLVVWHWLWSLRDTEFSAKTLHWSKMMTSRWTADPLSLYSSLYIASGTHMAIQVCVPNKYWI